MFFGEMMGNKVKPMTDMFEYRVAMHYKNVDVARAKMMKAIETGIMEHAEEAMAELEKAHNDLMQIKGLIERTKLMNPMDRAMIIMDELKKPYGD